MLSVTLQNEYFFPQSRGDSEEKDFRLEKKWWDCVVVVVSARFYSISSRFRFDSLSNCKICDCENLHLSPVGSGVAHFFR